MAISIPASLPPKVPLVRGHPLMRTDLPVPTGHPRNTDDQRRDRNFDRVPPLSTTAPGSGISTGLPSATPFGLALGPAKLKRTNLP